jgi:hypothetical protein
MPEELLILLLQPFLLFLAGGLVEAKPQVPFGELYYESLV